PTRGARRRPHGTGRREMRIGVAGVGLIGGSLALALRDRHEVTGYDTDERARAAAKGDGIRIVTRLDELLPADAVLVATPISAIVPALEHLATHSDGAVLLDPGSLKRAVADYGAAGPGFRDSTRPADTPADLATELLFGNAGDAAAAIESIVEGLTQLRDAIEREDKDYARSFLQAARSVRSELS